VRINWNLPYKKFRNRINKLGYDELSKLGYDELRTVVLQYYAQFKVWNKKLKNHNKRIKRLEKTYPKKIFKDIDKVIKRIKSFKSEVSPEINIGRQNAINDIENELLSVKKKWGLKK